MQEADLEIPKHCLWISIGHNFKGISNLLLKTTRIDRMDNDIIQVPIRLKIAPTAREEAAYTKLPLCALRRKEFAQFISQQLVISYSISI